MSLFIASINSGSNGNCYYVGNHIEAVLIDVGISCRETVKRMQRIGLDIEKVKAIFISHEHSDHIRGVEVLSKKYKLPVYISPATLKHSGLKLREEFTKDFKPNQHIAIGNLLIKPFPKRHDASDPYSFIVSGNSINIGVLTDIGSACEHVINNFKQCHAAFLEANYDEEMLQSGAYPFYLKKRISGENGHLSNSQSLDIFLKHKPEFMSHIILSHLSRENNSPQLVQKLFSQHAGNVEVVVASRDYETKVYHINTNANQQEEIKQPQISFVQTSLF